MFSEQPPGNNYTILNYEYELSPSPSEQLSPEGSEMINQQIEINQKSLRSKQSDHCQDNISKRMIRQCGIINKAICKSQQKQRQIGAENAEDEDSSEEQSNCQALQVKSKQSSSNSLNYKQYFSGSITSSKKKKKFQIANIVKSVVIDNSFLIPGQIIVNTQFDQGYQNVYINSNIYQNAKKVEKVVHNKERGTFESHFLTVFPGYSDFEFVIKMLESKQNQQIYEQAQVLKFYQQFVKTHQLAIKQIQESGILDRDLFQSNTQRFLQQGDEIVSKMSKDSIYIYFYNRINYEKAQYEELRFGFNKGLIAIVGLDEEEAVSFSNQMLILCMMTPESQLKYYMNVVQSEMSGQTCINVDYQQYTYEGIEITLTTKQQIYHFPGQFSEKDFSLRILEIEPDAFTLQQIIQERNKSGFNFKDSNQPHQFQKEQFHRYQAGLQFLQEFYENKQSKKSNKPLRCDFVMKDNPPIIQQLQEQQQEQQ